LPVGKELTAMAERTQKSKQSPSRTEKVEEVAEAPAVSESGEKLKAELDDLLDEIDDVLETNAEDFVKSFIQKGGE
jgi:prokaryotic ubiquitin-like protein Pup